MAHYFKHNFAQRQWVVTVLTRDGWLYFTGRGYAGPWRNAMVLTRERADLVARNFQQQGYKTRIKYQSLPSTRNMYR